MPSELNPWRLTILSAALCLFAGGCGDSELALEREEARASTEPITFVDHTRVENQTIGNCWVYAGASWVESLHLGATGQSLDTSQSYTTYWHWFEQIANQGASELSTGGNFSVFTGLLARYGVMKQADFIPEEKDQEASDRQRVALAAFRQSLATGELSTPEARKDRAKVRSELDKAWQLSPQTIAFLDLVFGPKVSKTLDLGYPLIAPPKGTAADGTQSLTLFRPFDLAAWSIDPNTKKKVRVRLSDVAGVPTWFGVSPYAWKSVNYPSSDASRRALQKRVQRAVHDHQPVIISWLVDFNAMTSNGTFTLAELERRGGPGHQGGHFVAIHDYEIDNVPGYGTLPAGTPETRPEALAGALDDAATIKFLRIKNSWGDYRSGAIRGYHDLYLSYLHGPIAACDVDASTGERKCDAKKAPLRAFVLPGGY